MSRKCRHRWEGKKILRKYYVVFFTSVKWFGLAVYGVVALFAVLVLIDWISPRWGYPMWVLPLLVVMLGFAFIFRKVAEFLLKTLRDDEGEPR